MYYRLFLEHFPFDNVRPEQERSFKALDQWLQGDKQFFGLDASTGVGKSAIAVAVARAVAEVNKNKTVEHAEEEYDDSGYSKEVAAPQAGAVWIITQNKLLQDQYLRDFKEIIYDLRGLDNYACFFDKGKSCGESKCGRVGNASKNDKEPPDECSKACEYDIIMKRARSRPILSLNIAKAFTLLKNPTFPAPAFIIIDEAHRIEDALDNEAGLSIDSHHLERLGFSFEKYFKDLKDLDRTVVGLIKLRRDCATQHQAEIDAHPDERNGKRIRQLETLMQKITEVEAAQEEGVEYVSCSESKVDLRPLQIFKVFRKFIKVKTLFLSATLLSKPGFRSLVGLSEEEFDWLAIPSPFPKENRPIYYGWQLGSPGFNYSNKEREFPKLIARIEEILAKYPDGRGIIHTHTYSTAEKIYEKLGHTGRIFFPLNSKEQKEVMERHARSRNGVLLSPSMTEGVDLKDELCRFSILCKVPYLPINDPVVEARMSNNEQWYKYKAVMTIVQACGRGVRNETDFSDTYLIDPSFQGFMKQAQYHFPNWFLEGIKPRPCLRN